MYNVIIHLVDGHERFTAGDIISGTVEVLLAPDVPLSSVSISFNCIGEVRWCDYLGTAYYLDGCVYYEKIIYYQDILSFTEKEITVVTNVFNGYYKAMIPFSFRIPKDKHLPSTMVSSEGLIQYNVCVTVNEHERTKKFIKEVTVQSPIHKNLMITVGGSAEKTVLLHVGKVTMHASIDRKGFACGEKVTVFVSVDNHTNTRVKPRIVLCQVQIYMSGVRHKTIENILNDEPVIGQEIGPHSQEKQLMVVNIPPEESLSIKSSIITVKYFINVTLDIPHSFDLQINLPIVLTTLKVIEELCEKYDSQELDSSK